MATETIYPVSPDALARTHLTREQYDTLYRQSIEDPDTFWAEQAHQFVTWSKPWQRVAHCDFEKAEIRWFEGAATFAKLVLVLACASSFEFGLAVEPTLGAFRAMFSKRAQGSMSKA